ncbi:MAG: DUF3810 domain-containing protein [Bacteroidales bacterium]|nr:DUF3810 domain-containing protein [Bacteroidales bacterium]
MKKFVAFVPPLLLLAFVVLCRISPMVAQLYVEQCYPVTARVLSCVASVTTVSIDEATFLLAGLWLLALIVCWCCRRLCLTRFLYMFGVSVLWIYVWFYMAWGNNYFHSHIYTRAGVTAVAYDDSLFQRFAYQFADSLNAVYTVADTVDTDSVAAEVTQYYRHIPPSMGLLAPSECRKPKTLLLNRIYTSVGVLGFMGPLFNEFHLNADLLPQQYPFTYAHELSHTLGVTNEAEANYWAFCACDASSVQAVRYSGYLAMFPYVVGNAYRTLPPATFDDWMRRIPAGVVSDYERQRRFWDERYSAVLGAVQNYVYHLYLKGNNIPSGTRNYAEVVQLLLSLPSPFTPRHDSFPSGRSFPHSQQ